MGAIDAAQAVINRAQVVEHVCVAEYRLGPGQRVERFFVIALVEEVIAQMVQCPALDDDIAARARVIDRTLVERLPGLGVEGRYPHQLKCRSSTLTATIRTAKRLDGTLGVGASRCRVPEHLIDQAEQVADAADAAIYL